MGFDKHYRKVVGTKADFTEQVIVLKAALVNTSSTPYSVVNPYAVALIVTKVVIDITTRVSSTPVTMSVGIGEQNVATDDLIDAVAIGTPTAIDVYDNVDDAGTNGKATVKWGASEYLNVTTSATPTDMVANIYVWYRKA